MNSPSQYSVFFEGRHVPLDENGHLVSAGDWTEGLARHLAEIDGMMLDDRHWLVIWFIREYHARFDSVPMPKVLIKD